MKIHFGAILKAQRMRQPWTGKDNPEAYAEAVIRKRVYSSRQDMLQAIRQYGVLACNYINVDDYGGKYIPVYGVLCVWDGLWEQEYIMDVRTLEIFPRWPE